MRCGELLMSVGGSGRPTSRATLNWKGLEMQVRVASKRLATNLPRSIRANIERMNCEQSRSAADCSKRSVSAGLGTTTLGRRIQTAE